MTLAYSALGLVLAIAAVALLARRTPAAPRVLEGTVTLEELFRPTGADDEAYCPAEERVRLHAFTGTGTRVCWTCRCETPTAVPRG
ncbi:hypothetical protein ELQ39_15785 [Streptomyces sp. GB4-14]|uniref:hypothetical protein n=1 Tax=Streptomyces sp. GB4-14 TaxID=2498703 RepID=UPI001F5E5AA8|nr:hypothetical protein [Streptomyces sp. GB4-14]